MPESVCELVRKNELEYTRGHTTTSKYVNFSMYDTISRIYAYINSTHISGEFDSLGREKPFFNISVAKANIWQRATDIDRKNVKVRATRSKDWIDAFLTNVFLQDWMRTENFGVYLNNWGRTLARFGSAITKIVENASGLHIMVMSWGRMIVDAVDFDSNPRIEIIELTEAQLFDRIDTHGYDAGAVQGLMAAITERETIDKRRKDNKGDYIRLYEVHGNLSYATLKKATGQADEITDADQYTFTQQMQVVAFVSTKKTSRSKETYEDFVLIAGREKEDPYRLDSLIPEEDRSLAVGAVEHAFEAQWMTNHAIKTEKDTLDIASRLVFQTADANYLNMNILENIESGDILIHRANMPLTQVNTGKYDITSMSNFRASWQALGNEVTGISEAMLGIYPKAGTPAAQTQQILQENYSLFEMMTENKGLALTAMLRERILPYIKETKLKSAKEISAMLDAYDIQRIDSVFMKNEAVRRTNKRIMGEIDSNLDRIAGGQSVQPINAGGIFGDEMQSLKESMGPLGNQRFFKPSELTDATWEEQLKDLEAELEIDITGEGEDVQFALGVLDRALSTVMQPGFSENKQAQAIVGRIFEMSGAGISPVEFASLPTSPTAPPPTATPTPAAPAAAPTGGV